MVVVVVEVVVVLKVVVGVAVVVDIILFEVLDGEDVLILLL